MSKKDLKLVEPGGSQPGPEGEKRKLLRLNFSEEQFRLNPAGKIFEVVNLSKVGMALRVLDPEDLIHFSVGASLEGSLNLNREKFSIEAKVRHGRRDLIGCEFKNLSKETVAGLEKFLNPKRLGRDLKPIPSGESGMLWYHSHSGTDLLLWHDNAGQYQNFVLIFYGLYVSKSEAGKFQTGKVLDSNEKSENRGALRLDTVVLHPDSKIEEEKVQIAHQIFSSSPVPEDQKSFCLEGLISS